MAVAHPFRVIGQIADPMGHSDPQDGADRENHDLRHKHPAEAERLAAAAQAMQEALSTNVRGWRAAP